MATPRTLIRALAADSEEKPAAVEQQQHMPTTSMLPPPAPPRRGGSGAITMSEDETPRRIIAGLAAGLDTEERLTESSSKRRRRGSNLPSAGGNSNDPKNMIRRFLRDAKTDSREKSPTRRDEYYALEDRYSPSTRMDDGEEEEEEAWFEEEEEEGLPAAPVAIVDKAPPGVVYLKHAKRAPKSEKRSDPFARECSQSFKAFLSRLPKPNRAQGEEVLEVAEEAAQAYLKQTARDYARLAKLDDASTHHMTKDRLELLLREQGLLVGNLGDEIRRLLDKEDAERALALPVSRARLERM